VHDNALVRPIGNQYSKTIDPPSAVRSASVNPAIFPAAAALALAVAYATVALQSLKIG
jgi:hypothetical protein